MGTFLYRMAGAAMLDGGMYEGIEADRSTTWQAAATVVLASLARGFAQSGMHRERLSTFAFFSAVAVVTWIVWAMLTLQIGSRILPEPDTRVDLGELLRTTGFAAAPGILQVFAVLPNMLWPVTTITSIWMIAAMIVAVKHALDYHSIARAVAVCLIALAVSAGVAFLVGMLLAPTVST